MTKQSSQNDKAFTLIELLVVVAIIGILSAIVLASLNVARTKGISSAKQQTIDQYRKALALYYYDNEFQYPNENLSDSFQVCLGENYPNGVCVATGTELASTSATDNPNVALEAYLSGHPTPEDSLDDFVTGLSYECKGGLCDDYYLYWFIEGSSCEFGEFKALLGGKTKCKIDQGD